MKRKLLVGLLLLVSLVSLVLVIEKKAEAQDSKELVVVSWGGIYQTAQRKGYFADFENETGIKVIETSPVDYAKLKAMVQSRKVEWDVMDAGMSGMFQLIDADVLEKIDYSKINTEGLVKEHLNEYGVPLMYYGLIMAYRKDVFPEGKGPQSWADFWDVKRFPGPRSLRNNPMGSIEFALLADGVPMNKIYPLDKAKVEQALKKLDQIKPHVTVWWEQGAQPAQLLADKEVVMTSTWNSRVYAIQAEGAPVEMVWNQGATEGDAWVIPKGAPHRDAALKFINFASRPKGQAVFAEMTKNGPSNVKAFDMIPSDIAKKLASHPNQASKMFMFDYKWWGKNRPWVLERWDAWMMEKKK